MRLTAREIAAATGGFHFTFWKQKISQPWSGYFTFCTCKIFHLSLNCFGGSFLFIWKLKFSF